MQTGWAGLHVVCTRGWPIEGSMAIGMAKHRSSSAAGGSLLINCQPSTGASLPRPRFKQRTFPATLSWTNLKRMAPWHFLSTPYRQFPRSWATQAEGVSKKAIGTIVHARYIDLTISHAEGHTYHLGGSRASVFSVCGTRVAPFWGWWRQPPASHWLAAARTVAPFTDGLARLSSTQCRTAGPPVD